MNFRAALMKDGGKRMGPTHGPTLVGSLDTEIIFTNKVKKMRKKKKYNKRKKTPGLSKKITKILKRERSSKRATTFLDPNYSELETEHWGRNWYGDYWLPNYTIDYSNYNPCDLPCDDSDLDSDDDCDDLGWRLSEW